MRGDAFIARVYDDEDSFRRMDFTLPELASDAPWVKAAKQQVRKLLGVAGAEAVELGWLRRSGTSLHLEHITYVRLCCGA